MSLCLGWVCSQSMPLTLRLLLWEASKLPLGLGPFFRRLIIWNLSSFMPDSLGFKRHAISLVGFGRSGNIYRLVSSWCRIVSLFVVFFSCSGDELPCDIVSHFHRVGPFPWLGFSCCLFKQGFFLSFFFLRGRHLSLCLFQEFGNLGMTSLKLSLQELHPLVSLVHSR